MKDLQYFEQTPQEAVRHHKNNSPISLRGQKKTTEQEQ